MKRRSDELSRKFTDAERKAYDWLWDCDIRPWVVDLLTKEVTTPKGKYKSLVEYANAMGADYDCPMN